MSKLLIFLRLLPHIMSRLFTYLDFKGGELSIYMVGYVGCRAITAMTDNHSPMSHGSTAHLSLLPPSLKLTSLKDFTAS